MTPEEKIQKAEQRIRAEKQKIAEAKKLHTAEADWRKLRCLQCQQLIIW